MGKITGNDNILKNNIYIKYLCETAILRRETLKKVIHILEKHI